MKRLALLLLVITTMTACKKEQKPVITRSNIQLQSDTLTPEALWAMGRIGSYAVSPDGKRVVYQVTYYSVPEDRSNTILYCQEIPASTTTAESGATLINAEQFPPSSVSAVTLCG